MVSAHDPFRPRTRDGRVMFVVTYDDGRSAYIRVSPETARHGNMIVLHDEKGGMSTVTQADVFQSNGVIHVVDTVILPK